MHQHGILAAGLGLLAAFPGTMAENMYPKSSAVLNVDSKSYDRLIAQSNYTSIVEFYAPWCGHCQNLKPAYEKAAKSLDGLAKVAAVNCDDDSNKGLCGQFGIQGFPTLKIVRPGKKAGKPAVEDYQGARTASGIVEAVQDKINNHVKKVTDKDLDAFFADEAPKAILITEKGTTSSLLKSIAIDFLGAVTIGQARTTQKTVVDKFGVSDFPALVLLPAGGADPIVYDGELKKAPLVEFISQIGAPNQDPPSKKPKEKKTTEKKAEKKKEQKTEEPAPEAAPEEAAAEEPSASPVAPAAAPIPSIATEETLQESCFAPKSHPCVLAIVPAADSEKKTTSLAVLAEIYHKHEQSGRHLFPFYQIPEENTKAAAIRESLSLGADVELVMVNARRSWYKRFQGELDAAGIESWIDAIRMGDGEKQKLPESLIGEAKVTNEETPAPAAEEAESSSAAGTVADAPEPGTDAPAEEPSEAPADKASEETIKHEEL